MTSGTTSTSSTRPSTPTPSPPSQSSTSYLSYPLTHIATSLYRRLTDTSPLPTPPQDTSTTTTTSPPTGLYTPPHRTASPYQPPPLTPLTLTTTPTPLTTPLTLTPPLAEEIRLLIPPRLQLASTWRLTYTLAADGVSLATLYSKCAEAPCTPCVLVVQDAAGAIFGAYLTDPPAPHHSYYGTGECFLWRASTISNAANSYPLPLPLPLPPSAPDIEIESMGRSTTIGSAAAAPSTSLSPNSNSSSHNAHNHERRDTDFLSSSSSSSIDTHHSAATTARNPTSTLRFKAFPYSGVNDYLIFCQNGFLSVGGGDGRYGLWLDRVLERGVSGRCLTFGNEGLSEEGEKFEVVGVEVWGVGG